MSSRETEDGNIWIGVYSGGINLYGKQSAKFTHYSHSSSNSLSNNFVLCFYEDDQNNLWIGTDGGGLNLFNKKIGLFTSYQRNGADQQHLGQLCAGCKKRQSAKPVDRHLGRRIKHLQPKNKKVQPVLKMIRRIRTASVTPNNIYAIAPATGNNMWIGTFGGGLDLYDARKKRFTHFQQNPKRSKILSAATSSQP